MEGNSGGGTVGGKVLNEEKEAEGVSNRGRVTGVVREGR